jgi:flagellar motor switch protein FliM
MQKGDGQNYEEYIEAMLRRIEIPVKAVLGKSQVSVNDFIGLQPGDIIRLGTGVSSEMEVYVGNIKKFTALPGSNGDKYAVRVTSVIREGE